MHILYLHYFRNVFFTKLTKYNNIHNYHVLPEEQIRWVFDNLRVNFPYFFLKHTLWVLIRIASPGYSLELPRQGNSNEYPQHMFLWRTVESYS